MPKLVIGSDRLLEPGKIYSSLLDNRAILRKGQFFKVVKESTRQEYMNCLIAFGEERGWAELYSVLDPYHYEIQTD